MRSCPPGVLVAAMLRNNEVLMADKQTVIEVGDRVVLFATKNAVKSVEKMFSVRLEFF